MILTTTPDIHARLRSWSISTNQSPELFINEAIDEALSDWEDYCDALRICAEVDTGKMRTYSLQEVEAHLDALDN